MFDIEVFPADARMLIVSRGFWDVPEAFRFKEAVSAGFRRLAVLNRPFRLLADLVELDLQSAAVSEVNAETAELIKKAPLDRYALVVSQALLRMQARRLLEGASYRMFDQRVDAAAWLNWPFEDLEQAIEASRGAPTFQL